MTGEFQPTSDLIGDRSDLDRTGRGMTVATLTWAEALGGVPAVLASAGGRVSLDPLVVGTVGDSVERVAETLLHCSHGDDPAPYVEPAAGALSADAARPSSCRPAKWTGGPR